ESRVFAPSAEFAAAANVTAQAYTDAAADREGFWATQAERLTWDTPWTQILDWTDAPFAKWFIGGTLNVAYNCVDRHVEAGLGDRVAIHWIGEPGDTATITYEHLRTQVCKTANALTELGLVAGDRVAIQLPMIPEAVYAMLACARLGLIHTVVFGGFSATALRTRIEDTAARLLITSDGQYRRGTPAPMKNNTDHATTHTPTIEHVLVVKRTNTDIDWTEGRDLWWHDTVDHQPDHHTPQPFDAEHPLFILYTSGTTGKPKGILHTTGGYLTQASYTHHAVFDLKPDTDIYWCTADIGWITGHTYIVYGPLSNATTQIIYEGTPNTPDEHRHFHIIDTHNVTIYYTAPTLIRTFMKWGPHIPAAHNLTSLRLLGSVGEPINPEAWLWYHNHIGPTHIPIVDTWWQTETGAIMISPLPGVTHTKPGSAQQPLPGITATILDDTATPITDTTPGYLTLTQPWPAMLRGIWGNPQRYHDTYWTRFPGHYFAGDGAKYDTDHHIWLQGRIDDVMNISGHRISTTEIESALVSHPTVAEAAVVGATDPTTGQAIVAFVILRANTTPTPTTPTTLQHHVTTTIGPIAKPRTIHIVTELPKTRSGKIMRRLLQDIAEHRPPGDTTTLADTTVIDLITTNLTNTPTQD
ncbi:acetate--CoA ligase, partial [Actinokineospora sp.]|uniref:acetate--CoA ligase n=1 Tax=Actinokineospora sp. TaxID=1872133 RepID=UPI0040379374